MRIHIIQHVFYESPGSILDWLQNKNFSYTISKIYQNEKLPEVDEFDWLIVMGGPMGVHDNDLYPWLGPEKELITAAIQNGRKVLGICLGAQLIAYCLGSEVTRCPQKEIGWWSVELSAAGSKIFQETKLDVFQWHGDTFAIPQNATSLASSDGCPNQGFIYENRVIGLQFHLEVTNSIIQDLLKEGNSELVQGKFIQTAEQISKKSANLSHYHEKMNQILDFFL